MFDLALGIWKLQSSPSVPKTAIWFILLAFDEKSLVQAIRLIYLYSCCEDTWLLTKCPMMCRLLYVLLYREARCGIPSLLPPYCLLQWQPFWAVARVERRESCALWMKILFSMETLCWNNRLMIVSSIWKLGCMNSEHRTWVWFMHAGEWGRRMDCMTRPQTRDSSFEYPFV